MNKGAVSAEIENCLFSLDRTCPVPTSQSCQLVARLVHLAYPDVPEVDGMVVVLES
jgi:hypothetical protein